MREVRPCSFSWQAVIVKSCPRRVRDDTADAQVAEIATQALLGGVKGMDSSRSRAISFNHTDRKASMLNNISSTKRCATFPSPLQISLLIDAIWCVVARCRSVWRASVAFV